MGSTERVQQGSATADNHMCSMQTRLRAVHPGQLGHQTSKVVHCAGLDLFGLPSLHIGQFMAHSLSALRTSLLLGKFNGAQPGAWESRSVLRWEPYVLALEECRL